MNHSRAGWRPSGSSACPQSWQVRPLGTGWSQPPGFRQAGPPAAIVERLGWDRLEAALALDLAARLHLADALFGVADGDGQCAEAVGLGWGPVPAEGGEAVLLGLEARQRPVCAGDATMLLLADQLVAEVGEGASAAAGGAHVCLLGLLIDCGMRVRRALVC